MNRPSGFLEALHPRWVGFLGTILIMLGSFGAGTTRIRGGFLAATNLEFLSYGHGQTISGILLTLGTVLFILGWVLLGRQIYLGNSTQPTLTTVGTTVIYWIIPLLFADPILSRDVFSYLMQGAMVRDGFDPYTQAISVDPSPMFFEVAPDWRNTTTAYGPLQLWISKAIVSLVGDQVTLGVLLFKMISVAGFLCLCWLIPLIAAQLGGVPTLALWLGVANPIMVFHLVGGMHNESITVVLVSLGILASLRNRFALGVASIAAAVAVKATAAIALPFIVVMATNYYAKKPSHPEGLSSSPPQPDKMRICMSFFTAAFLCVAETIAIVAAITWASGASWGWLFQITGNYKVMNPLSAPTLLADLTTPLMQLFDESFKYSTALSITRSVCTGVMVAGLITVWWYFRQNNNRIVWGITAAYGVVFLFYSVTFPWYYASLITLLGVQQIPRRVLQWAIALSVVIALSFNGNGTNQLYNPTGMLLFTLTGIAAAWWITVAKRPSLEPCA